MNISQALKALEVLKALKALEVPKALNTIKALKALNALKAIKAIKIYKTINIVMKNKKLNVQIITDAIIEYESSSQTYIEICNKYGVNSSSFFYHLKKHRMNKSQSGGTVISTIPNDTSSSGDKLVFLDTTDRKMTAYMKQHNIKQTSDEKKKKPERVDLDKVFEGL